MLPTRPEYERFIYTIVGTYPAVEKSTLSFFTTSATAGLLKGSIWFRNGLELRVVEVIDFAAREFLDYSYVVYRSKQKIIWYDPQPHPEDAALTKTFPHHKHELPNIRQNRKSAPGITFSNSNLPGLIAEIAALPPKEKFIEK